jgi:hypothetical protein
MFLIVGLINGKMLPEYSVQHFYSNELLHDELKERGYNAAQNIYENKFRRKDL